MKIVFITDWFSEKMGYSENTLPKAVAALGHEVHLLSANIQTYFGTPIYASTYEPFLGPGVVPLETRSINGVIVHRLPHQFISKQIRIRGLWRELWKLKPQVVQTFAVAPWPTYEATAVKAVLGYRLFTESHVHASVFEPTQAWQGIRKRLNWLVYAGTVGRWVSTMSEKCYPISEDAAAIAIEYFGVQKHKVDICPLGVDTLLFKPAETEQTQTVRTELRTRLGFSASDIVCVYTGRFSRDKNPLCLAHAIAELCSKGKPFRGLFVGDGAQCKEIEQCAGCVVHRFVPTVELPPFYWASEIGVWPAQESTSQLDAAACGLPIVISASTLVVERVTGNGLTYKEGDASDLANVLASLQEADLRNRMGSAGVTKMEERFSWRRIAESRIKDYEKAIG